MLRHRRPLHPNAGFLLRLPATNLSLMWSFYFDSSRATNIRRSFRRHWVRSDCCPSRKIITAKLSLLSPPSIASSGLARRSNRTSFVPASRIPVAHTPVGLQSLTSLDHSLCFFLSYVMTDGANRKFSKSRKCLTFSLLPNGDKGLVIMGIIQSLSVVHRKK